MSLAQHRSRSVAEIVDSTFTFYRANLAALVTLFILVLGPGAILKSVAPPEWQAALDVVGNLLIPLGQGAVAAMVAASVELDTRLSLGAALRAVAGRTGSLIGVQITSGLMMIIGLILLVVPGVIALIVTAVGIPVVVIEDLGYSKALERSRALVRGRWKPVLGTLLLSWGIAFLLLMGAAFILGLLNLSERVAGLLIDLLIAAILPVPAIAMTLLYYDLRVRTEGADLDAMAAALPAPEPAI
jgi:hypothetical protein